jgi:hypothetical protein
LSPAQRDLVLASEPDDVTGTEGVGVELHGQEYQTAKALQNRGIGHYTHGSVYIDMYWNNNTGLLVRDYIRMHLTPPPSPTWSPPMHKPEGITTLPWKVSGQQYHRTIVYTYNNNDGLGDREGLVASMEVRNNHDDTQLANAAYIVQSANHFLKMKEALEEIASPFVIASGPAGKLPQIDYEAIAREFSRRQGLARSVLSSLEASSKESG